MRRAQKWGAGALGLLGILGLSYWVAQHYQSADTAPPLLVELAVVPSPPQAEQALARLDVQAAARYLKGAVGPAATTARARLQIYQADCEGAVATLASAKVREHAPAQALYDFARGCQGATIGGLVVEDREQGIWLRLQDEADEVLAPELMRVAVAARETLEADLGIDLPRPLRIDLVRDLYSLGLVSGLPVEAAETTGTVAVAKWGRVTMVTPRAPVHGFPWQDTLAHEITHLLLSRGSADRAPLWLQEGIAKREETRWRAAFPHDKQEDPAEVAYLAEREGRAVGITKIGPSIAMLPSADAAGVAFAEVSAFMHYWIEKNGPHALPLLIRELAVSKNADDAMRAVSGFSIEEWERIFRADLQERFASRQEFMTSQLEPTEAADPRALAQSLRLSELLLARGWAAEASAVAGASLELSPHFAALRFAAARAALVAGLDSVDWLLAQDVEQSHAGWLALRARLDAALQSNERAEALLHQAFALDPYAAIVACGGVPHPGWQESFAARNHEEASAFDLAAAEGFTDLVDEYPEPLGGAQLNKQKSAPSSRQALLPLSAEMAAICARAQRRIPPEAL